MNPMNIPEWWTAEYSDKNLKKHADNLRAAYKETGYGSDLFKKLKELKEKKDIR